MFHVEFDNLHKVCCQAQLCALVDYADEQRAAFAMKMCSVRAFASARRDDDAERTRTRTKFHFMQGMKLKSAPAGLRVQFMRQKSA